MQNLAKKFAQWIDTVLSSDLPLGIAAFHFNLYDGPQTHDVQLVGCPAYDPDDADWACDDIFMSANPRFELSHEVVGACWEQGLQAATQLLKVYMASDAAGAVRMRQSQAVSLGYVDGDLHLVWQRDGAV